MGGGYSRVRQNSSLQHLPEQHRIARRSEKAGPHPIRNRLAPGMKPLHSFPPFAFPIYGKGEGVRSESRQTPYGSSKSLDVHSRRLLSPMYSSVNFVVSARSTPT